MQDEVNGVIIAGPWVHPASTPAGILVAVARLDSTRGRSEFSPEAVKWTDTS